MLKNKPMDYFSPCKICIAAKGQQDEICNFVRAIFFFRPNNLVANLWTRLMFCGIPSSNGYGYPKDTSHNRFHGKKMITHLKHWPIFFHFFTLGSTIRYYSRDYY